MKKQASNTFTEGLLKDFHPLTVGNNVMTDALNATIVTMNGNEGILQNDMGNGRVESAFLPAGYVPVGMKEYGGIIYVASYNPITNKGQIGSFPSPERNIDQTENDEPENPLELLNNIYIRTYKYTGFNEDKYQKGIAGLTNKTDIFGEDKYIRAGDKFGFYFDNTEHTNQTSVLSNYFQFNYEQLKPYGVDEDSNIFLWDSKNNIYRNNIITLSTEVLDINNNLRDITEQLKRYDLLGDRINTENIKNKIDIFNSGYFISNIKNLNWDNVNKERNKRALNTYNNKLYGKMFLVGTVNTPNYIDVSYRFVREEFFDTNYAIRIYYKNGSNLCDGYLCLKYTTENSDNPSQSVNYPLTSTKKIGIRLQETSSIKSLTNSNYIWNNFTGRLNTDNYSFKKEETNPPDSTHNNLYIKYSNYSNGLNLDANPFYQEEENGSYLRYLYIGFAIGLESNDVSNPEKYVWVKWTDNPNMQPLATLSYEDFHFDIDHSINITNPSDTLQQVDLINRKNLTNITYESSNTRIISIDSTGITTFHPENTTNGIVTIKAIFGGNNIYSYKETQYKINVNVNADGWTNPITRSFGGGYEIIYDNDHSQFIDVWIPSGGTINTSIVDEDDDDEHFFFNGIETDSNLQEDDIPVPNVDYLTTTTDDTINNFVTNATFSCIKFIVDEYYNCPDKYIQYPKIICSLQNKDLESEENPNWYIEKYKQTISNYDEFTNLYKTTFEYYIQPVNAENCILHYLFIPQCKNLSSYIEDTDVLNASTSNGDTRLTHIAVEGSIDLSKIGTKSSINVWKYRYIGNQMHLVWGLEDYLYDDDVVSDMKMEFYDINSGNIATPVYTRELYDKSGSSIGEYFDLDTEGNLQSRHIYLVKLSRIKNEIDEELGYRIMITTSIYNDLFNIYDDYYSEGAKYAINQKNIINIELDISENNYNSSGIDYDNVEEHMYVKDNNNIYQKNQNLKFQNYINEQNLDTNKYLLTKYYSTKINSSLRIELSIPEIYPFEIKTPENISYNINITPKQEKNDIEYKKGRETLPILEDISLVNEYKQSEIKVNNVILNGSISKSGNTILDIENDYYFPSVLLYQYEGSKKELTFNGTFKNFITYVNDDLDLKDVVFPIVAVRPESGDHVGYCDLLRYNIHDSTIDSFSGKNDKDSNEEYELFGYEGHKDRDRKLSQNMSEINLCLDNLGLNNFCIFASPFVFSRTIKNHNNDNVISDSTSYHGTNLVDHIIGDLLGYTNPSGGFKPKINWMLYPNRNTTENVDDPTDYSLSYYYWAFLMWRNTNNEFVIVNKAFMYNKQVMTVETLVKEIFRDFTHLYFKTDNTKTIKAQFIDLNNCSYNDDYTISVYNNLSIDNITISNTSNLLSYFDYNNNSVGFNNDASPKTIIQNIPSELLDYLKFSISGSSNSSNNTKKGNFNIPGTYNIINESTFNLNESIIEHNVQDQSNNTITKYYTRDKNGNKLYDNFYIIRENDTVCSMSDIYDSSITDFVNKLSISDNKVIITAGATGGNKESNYKYTTNKSNNNVGSDKIKLTERLGDFKSIDLPYDSNSTYRKLFS